MWKTGEPNRRCDGVSRREVFRLGQLAGLGIGLPHYLAAADQISSDGATPSKAKSCILVWLDGGPSHLETFDMKPNASSEVRGPLAAISSSVPGIQLSECLPQLAQRMQDFAIIRSMTSPLGEHNLGAHYLLTGYRPTPVINYPSFHAVANQQLKTSQEELPNNIAIPEYQIGGAGFDGTGFLGSEYGPFSLRADPAAEGFSVRNLLPGKGLTLDRINSVGDLPNS